MRVNGNFPAFLAPTQSTAKFDQARFDSARLSFRERPGLALYLQGRLSALLDGHHRATCAAMHGERFRALTISAAHVDNNQGKCFLAAHQVSVPIDEVASANRGLVGNLVRDRSFGVSEWKDLDVDAYHALLQRVVWPELPKWVTSVINPANYWNNDKLDALAWFSRRGVAVEQEMIEEALAGNVEHAMDRWVLTALLKTLFAVEDPRAVVTAVRVTQSPGWSLLWERAYQLLSTVRSEEVENQFVQFLIDDDGSRPEIRAIVDRYFESAS